ncbi:MAG TPA: hypothetical protein VG939_19905, partial [Caulobacteraceae bacterium]|nr:hypothetical protein [Caulobacteraceae bacterium]
AAEPAGDPIGDALARPPAASAAPSPDEDPPAPASQAAPEAAPPPTAGDEAAYEARIRASVAAAQGLQGPMDGRWTLVGADGKPLYVFQFVDPPGGYGTLQGAWQNPRRTRGADDLGVVDRVERSGPGLTLIFVSRTGAAATTVRLQGGAAGGFAGQIDEDGQVQTVSLRR